jgi:hypothetical protein
MAARWRKSSSRIAVLPVGGAVTQAPEPGPLPLTNMVLAWSVGSASSTSTWRCVLIASPI